MRPTPLGLAINEFREHWKVYVAIVGIISLSMTVFTTQNALSAYQDYAATKSVGILYGDATVVKAGVSVRKLLSGAPPMTGADEFAKKIEALGPGWRAMVRAEADSTPYYETFKACPEKQPQRNCPYPADAGAIWGIDLTDPEAVDELREHVVEGDPKALADFFSGNKSYTQAAMGAPLGTVFQNKPTVTGANPPQIDFPQHYTDPPQQLPYPILIGRAASALHNLSIGDEFLTNTLTSPQRGTFAIPFFKVIGIYESGQPKFEELNYFTSYESMLEIQGAFEPKTGNPGADTPWYPGSANYIAVRGPPGMEQAEVVARLEEIVDSNKEVKSQDDLKVIWSGNLGGVANVLLYATVGAALLLAATAIKFVMDSVVIRKTREIGTLKALGATDGEVVRVFLYQAVFLGFASSITGYGLAHAVMWGVQAYGLSIDFVLGTKMEIRFLETPLSIALSLALPLVVAVLAAVVPCIHVARLAPVEALRRGAEGTQRATTRVQKGATPARKLTRKLAWGDLTANSGIYGIIILTVAIALGTYGLQSAFRENLEQQVRIAVIDTVSGHGMVMAPDQNPRMALAGAKVIENAGDIVREVNSMPGWKAVPRTSLEGLIFLDRPGGQQEVDGIAAVGIDPTLDEEVLSVRDKIVGNDSEYFDPNADYSQAAQAAAQRNASIWFPSVFSLGGMPRPLLEPTYPVYPAILGKPMAVSNGLDIGSEFTCVFNSPTAEDPSRRVASKFRVIGMYESGLPFNDLLLMYIPLVAANELRGFSSDQATVVIAQAPPDLKPEEIEAALAEVSPEGTILSWHEMTLYYSGAVFDAMALITNVAILITLLLAGVAILFAMDATVKRKTKEIGTLKALGATDREVVGLFLRQAFAVGIGAGALAVLGLRGTILYLLSLDISADLPLGTSQKLGFVLTPAVMAIVFTVPLVVAMLASVAPSMRAARLSPVEALREGELAQ